MINRITIEVDGKRVTIEKPMSEAEAHQWMFDQAVRFTAVTGLLAPHVTRALWALLHRSASLTARHRGKVLSFAGPLIVVALVGFWATGLTLGAALVIQPELGTTIRPASQESRLSEQGSRCGNQCRNPCRSLLKLLQHLLVQGFRGESQHARIFHDHTDPGAQLSD